MKKILIAAILSLAIVIVGARLSRAGLFMLALSSTAPEIWPTGADGPLTIANGQTVRLTSGTVKDYSSLTINSGGILEVSAADAAFVAIGVAGTFTNNGIVRAVESTASDAYTMPTYTVADGYVMNWSISAPVGGQGGRGGEGYFSPPDFCRTHQAQAYGNGGGGLSGSVSDDFDGSFNCESPLYSPTRSTAGGWNGGVGCVTPNYGSIFSGVGGNSTTSGDVCGAGGGARGHHGGFLYIKAFSLAGNGTFNVSGTAGGKGGDGSPGGGVLGHVYDFWGSGGGGAGGQGGKLVIKYHSSSFSGTTNVAGGAGGAHGAQASSDGSTDGTAGATGTADLTVY